MDRLGFLKVLIIEEKGAAQEYQLAVWLLSEQMACILPNDEWPYLHFGANCS